MAGEGKSWLPIESNPAVMTRYAKKLGVSSLKFYDLLSTEDWALEMIPKPVHAVLLLFPIKPATEAHSEEEATRIATVGQHVDPQLYFTKQTIPNACGTIGIIHSVAAASDLTGGPVTLDAGSWLDTFLRSTLGKSPEERAAALEADEDAAEVHDEVVAQGQSDVVDDTWNHFIALVHKGGSLYEMDGRKAGPINHGATTPEAFLGDAVRVLQAFMARDPGEVRFTMVALAAHDGEEDEEEEGEGGEAAAEEEAAAAPAPAPAT